MSSGISDTRLFVGILFGLIATLTYCLPKLSSAQVDNNTSLTVDNQPQIDKFIPEEVTLDKQQIQDVRSILNSSIESLEKGNITEAINNLRIADDQLRILED
jgi:hypothetical protein